MSPVPLRERPRRTRRYWLNLAGFTVLCGVLGLIAAQYVGAPYYLTYGYTHPKRLPVCCETPADRGLLYEEVVIRTADGLDLRGWYVPGSNRAAVIALHSIASNRVMMLGPAALLARHGYGVLLLDLRAHGESDGDLYPYGGPEAEDVRAAADYLAQRADVDPGRIGLLGFSLGAQTGLLGAARTPAIRAVVADGPGATTFTDWPPARTPGEWAYVPFDLVFYRFLQWRTGVREPLSVQAAIAQVAPRPILLIGGGRERRALEHLASLSAAPPAQWVVPEAGHLESLALQPDEYEQRVSEFFDAALLVDMTTADNSP